jgi:ABC-type dipeptide/oligopeptide/nickel transport system permease component
MSTVLYIIKRTLSLMVSFLLVSVIIFSLMHSIPGGPFDESKMPLPEATKKKIMAQFGLDKPLHEQYFLYMKGVLKFDFGVPYQSPGETITEVLARAWPPSLILGGLGMIFGTILGILLGILAALRKNSTIDYAVSVGSTLGITVPIYVISLLLMMVFAVWLRWVPTQGWGGSPVNSVLPIICYAVAPMAIFSRYTRSSILEILGKPFVTVLRAKGLSTSRILFKHVLRNAAIPLVTIFFPSFIGIATGSIFVEQMFQIPGLGQYFVTSLAARDYPMEMSLILILTLLIGITYILTDILYTILNPVIRLKKKNA